MSNFEDVIRGVKENLNAVGEQFEREFIAARQTYEKIMEDARAEMDRLQKEAAPPTTSQPQYEGGIYLTSTQVKTLLTALQAIAETIEQLKKTV